MDFLEYGTSTGLPKRVSELWFQQIRAAVLADVEGLSHRRIAEELGLEYDKDRYEVNKKISQVEALVRNGRDLLSRALGGKESWKQRAEAMKAEAKRYSSLTEEEKKIEALAESIGETLEEARSLYKANPGLAKFLSESGEY
jgi:DNA repair ATPase RecN